MTDYQPTETQTRVYEYVRENATSIYENRDQFIAQCYDKMTEAESLFRTTKDGVYNELACYYRALANAVSQPFWLLHMCDLQQSNRN